MNTDQLMYAIMRHQDADGISWLLCIEVYLHRYRSLRKFMAEKGVKVVPGDIGFIDDATFKPNSRFSSICADFASESETDTLLTGVALLNGVSIYHSLCKVV